MQKAVAEVDVEDNSDVLPLVKMLNKPALEKQEPNGIPVQEKAKPPRDNRLFMTRLADQASCPEEMIEYLADLMDYGELSSDERNLVATAFKNYIEHDRKSFEMVADIQEFENLQKFQRVLAQFKNKIEKLLVKKCSLII